MLNSQRQLGNWNCVEMAAEDLDPGQLSLQACTTGYHVPMKLFLHYLNKHWSFFWDQQDSFLRNHLIEGKYSNIWYLSLWVPKSPPNT